MLLEQKINVKWHVNNRKWYESKGYTFTKYKDEFEVDIKDLSRGSRSLIKLKCDYCGIEIDRVYNKYYEQNINGIVHKDCCVNCMPLKLKESFLLQYGVENINYLQEIKDKKIDICRKNYGVDHPGQSEEITEKMKRSRIEKLGTPWAMQNYSVREKTKKTLFENGTVACSKQQKYLCNLLCGQLNYPIGNCSVDILLNDNIIVEYNGGGHDKNVKTGVIARSDFDNKERKRDYFLKSYGYKIIKIISPRDYLPKTDTKIIEIINSAIQYMKINNVNHFNIEFGDKIIDPIYGKLRKITKKTLEEQESKLMSLQLIENIV